MDTITVETKACMSCGKTSVVTLTAKEYEAISSGELIQNALPDWSAGQRELLITGIHSDCYDSMFAHL